MEIHWELCKRQTFSYADKYYIHKVEFVQENEMHNVVSDFQIKIGRQKFVIKWILLFQQKEDEKPNEYLDLAKVLKNLTNMKVTVIPIVVGALGRVPNNMEKERGIRE